MVQEEHLRSVHYHNFNHRNSLCEAESKCCYFNRSFIRQCIYFELKPVGYFCGWFGHKHKIKGSDNNITSQAAPVYEDIQLSTFVPHDQEKAAFELIWSNMTNLAT